MSQNSKKQLYTQLKEWLGTRETATKVGRKQTKKFSKADHYKSRR